MRRLQTKFLIFSVLFLLHFNAGAQSAELNSIADSSVINHIINIYEEEIGQQSHLYNGKEYQNYAYKFREGNPFFVTDTWQKGNVSYDGTLYSDIPLLYDIVRDEVVIRHFNKISRINLIKEKVSAFTLPGHSFINILPDSIHSPSINGFYELLYAGKDSLLAKRTKNMQILYKATAAELKVFAGQSYYLKKHGKYYPVNNENAFFRQFDDKKKEIRKYKKLNKLKYKKDPENTMVKIMSYHDQLTN